MGWLKNRRAVRRSALLRDIVPEACALADRSAREHSNIRSWDKLMIALSWCRDECARHALIVSDNELRKLIEIHLELANPGGSKVIELDTAHRGTR